MTSFATSTPETADSRAKPRIASLDQFRGYTVAGMLLVNFFGSYDVCPQVWKHTHDYCSYADTIMPQFLFAVGFGLRLTFGRRLQTHGRVAAYGRMVRRLLGLMLVAFIIYHVPPRAASWEQLKEIGPWQVLFDPLKRGWFQTLMHIAVTSLWILPVIHCGWRTRILWMICSAVLHVSLSYAFNFVWVNTAPNGIDGGPLGFLTWSIPAIVGTLACDVFVRLEGSRIVSKRSKLGVAVASVAMMVAGYVFSCGTRLYDVPDEPLDTVKPAKLASDPVMPDFDRIRDKVTRDGVQGFFAEAPFVKPPKAEHRQWNYWMMSQRAGTLSYLTFSAGFSLFVFSLFFVACDLWNLRLPFFRTLGTNALVAYVLDTLVGDAVKPFFPKDSPLWYASLGLLLFFGIVWTVLRQFEKQGIYLRV